jgi:AraC-like DNA-binding protein
VKRLNRLCREEWFSGKNCYMVVMDRIMSKAEYLLLGSDLEMKAIGFELGFSSGSNFATYFVRYKGITPVQFRRAGKQK